MYSRFRYTETKINGFKEVHEAWASFAQNGALSKPEGDGWNLSRGCLVLDGPGDRRNQNDAAYWAKAQEQNTFRRVFMQPFGIADTPAEKALEAKEAAARKARLAAEEQARAASEAEKRAAAQRALDARNARVDSIAAAIGPAKRAEAERLQKMNEELAALRPKPVARPVAAPSPAPTQAAPRQCTQRTATRTVTNVADTQDKARAAIARATGSGFLGGSELLVSSKVGAPTCTQRNQLALKPPPVGKCLGCISEAMAEQYGWVPGKGYPPPKTEWTCSAPLTYTAERCGTGSSKVSAQ